MNTFTLAHAQLGNASDTSGASVEEVIIFEQKDRDFKAFTKRGVVVGVVMEKEYKKYFYSTMLIPYNYPNAEQPPAEIAEKVKNLEVLLSSKRASEIFDLATKLHYLRVAI